MKKNLPVGILMMFLFGVVFVVSASAETTKEQEWLTGGSEVTANLASETIGSLLFEDTETIAGKVAVTCSAILDGTVGSQGKDEITRVLNTTHEEVGVLGGLALLCVTNVECAAATEASPIEVWPIGLPWATLVFLMENGETLDLVSASSFGYELLCLILGINTTDTCTEADAEVSTVNNASGEASIPNKSVLTPNALCAQSNKETGVNEVSSEALIKLTDGELLSIE